MSDLFFVGAVPWWAILSIGLGALSFLVYQFLSLRQRLSLQRTWLLISLRGLVYAVLLFFLFGPGLAQKQVTKLRRPLTVLVDSSASMALPASPNQRQEGTKTKTRIDLVKEKLLEGKEPLIQRLTRDYDLRLYQFATQMEPMTPSAIAQLAARGAGTRLLEVLRQSNRDSAAAVILFSDGIANGETQAVDKSTTFPLPVFTVGVGESKGYTDLHIADLRVPEFAFRGRELKIEFSIEAYGLAGKTVPLYFNRGSHLISSRSVTIDRDPFVQRLTLNYIPKELGPQSFTLSVPLQAGEEIAHNNQREFRIEVQRDKIRVLTLSGAPSWNYRFLRMALKQDPFIDLVSFVFLRTPTDSVDVPDSQLSLIPFPIDEIFLEELKNFDVLIFDDFSHRSYFNILYLERVRDFVRDGGGFTMLGGIRSFDSGGYGESPLREVLPVELDGKGAFQTGVSLRGIPTQAGNAHPMTRLFPEPRANEEAWKKMPPITTLNRIFRAKGETLLMAVVDGAGAGYPLLTLGRFGKGRTLALMSDDFWRWSFVAVGSKESPQSHLKLIRQAVRWLAQEPSFEQVQILSIGGSSRPGEKASFRVRVLKDDFGPAGNAVVRLNIVGPDGEKIPLEGTPEAEEGEYSAEFTPAKEGSYRLEAQAHLAGRLVGRDRKNFQVNFPYGEREDGRPRLDLLKQIAEASRGEFIPISEWNGESLQRVAAKLESLVPSEIVEQRQIQLWNSLWTFSLVVGLLSTEWWMRRKWGLV